VQELEAGPLHRFQDWPNDQVPKRAAGVYSVWEGDRLLYVGMSGRAMTAEDLEVSPNGRVGAKGLWTRLNAHASGRRSGDQFCVYVCDRFGWSVASQERCKRLGTQAPVSMLCGGGDRLGNHLLGC
jgi:hypothetical protein